jgi:2',3'-cyclic-nucleotide 2'-phosphodiesterase (5'-nucleotidase family)
MMRKEEVPLLLVDAGGIIAENPKENKLRADVSLKGMKLIGYDAINLGAPDFSLGLEYLKGMASEFSIPFVSSNLISENKNEPWFKNYIIREFGGIKVGILGLISPKSFDALPNRAEITGLRAVSPESVLEKTITRLREEVDAVLLLSHLGQEETDALPHEIRGIDITVIASTDEKISKTGATFAAGADDGTGTLCAIPKSEALGALEIQISPGNRINVLNDKQIALDDSVSLDPEINDLITSAYLERKKEDYRKKQEDLHRQLRKGLELSPEEFIKAQEKDSPAGPRPGI